MFCLFLLYFSPLFCLFFSYFLDFGAFLFCRWPRLRQEKTAQRLTFWVWRLPGGVGVFHAKGWWPKTSCSPSKVCLPWVSKRGIWDVPAILPGCPGPWKCPKSLCFKKFLRFFFVPYIWESEMVSANRVAAINPVLTIRTRYGNSVSTPEATRTGKTQQNSLQKGSRYGISVSTPHRRYGHRLRTPFLRMPFPRLLLQVFARLGPATASLTLSDTPVLCTPPLPQSSPKFGPLLPSHRLPGSCACC